MNAPQIYTTEQIKIWDVTEKRISRFGNPYWAPARPVHIASLRKRLRLAWKVFTGECDALYWGDS